MFGRETFCYKDDKYHTRHRIWPTRVQTSDKVRVSYQHITTPVNNKTIWPRSTGSFSVDPAQVTGDLVSQKRNTATPHMSI